jgi:hypothetical protein
MSDAALHKAFSTLRGATPVYVLYPVIGAGAGAGTTLLNAGAANTFGADTELIAAATIVGDFWFCQIQPTAVSVAENYVVSIEEAGTTTIFEFRLSATLVTSNIGPYQPPYPVQIAGGTQITGRCASVGGADTVDVSVLVATAL